MPAAPSKQEEDNQGTTRVFGAIPARYASTRLPGKPLRMLVGKPLIEHVYGRALAAKELDRVVVLTDDSRVLSAVRGFGGEAEMTPADCVSGTDRIASAALHWQTEAVVNIQGDEPLIDPQAIDRVARHLKTRPQDPMVTLAAPAAPAARQDPNVVKVVVDLSGRALYFSRSPIPHGGELDAPETLHHIGIYGYQKEALLAFAALEPTPLERCESLEQLRALENGIGIHVLRVERAWQGVDTMADLEQVERLLQMSGANDH